MQTGVGAYGRYVKRPLDIILSLCAIIALSPVLLIIAALVRFKLGSPVIFRQKRPGLKEKIFTLYKFRTMTDEKDEYGELLQDGIRLTGFGKMLRNMSLDELPELFNILKGDMSFLGPRPLLVGYLEYYNDRQRRRHDIRPGLSGLAQVSGRNALSWEEKFELDIEYADNITFIGDLRIMLKTIITVFLQDGINSGDSVASETFEGTREAGECPAAPDAGMTSCAAGFAREYDMQARN